MLGIDRDLMRGAILWVGLGFGGGGWFWGPVGVHAELLGQMHIASFGCFLAKAAEQKLVDSQVDSPLKIR